jgi:hypothetical protein
MVTPRHIALATLALAACVPPAGLGPGPVTVPRKGAAASGGVGFGASAERETFQVDGTLVMRPSRHFQIEGGLAYTLMRVDTDEGELIAHSGLPYVRPTLVIRGAQLGVALSGLGAGGGGGGAFYGLFGVRAGYGRDYWSAYAEWLVHVSNLTAEVGIDSSSRQYRVGFDYEWELGDASRLGAAFELADIDESFEAQGHEFDERHIGAMIKLRVRGVFERF